MTDTGTVTYAYNGEGRRVEKSTGQGTIYYLYEYDKVVLEVDGTGDQVARNLYGINLLMRDVDEDSYYYVYNGHADVTALIDADTGNVEATYYYDPFGNILESTGDVNNNITYAGYQYDEETELYYLNARMYDPKVARFLQEDTYRGDPNDPLSLNLYAYVNNNPLVYYDPMGYSPVEIFGIPFGNPIKGAKTVFNKEKRKEAFEVIDEHGTNAEKVLSRAYAGIGVGATVVAGTATIVYTGSAAAAASLKLAASSKTAAFAMSNATPIVCGTLGVGGGGAGVVDNIKNEEYEKIPMNIANMAIGGLTLWMTGKSYFQMYGNDDTYSSSTTTSTGGFWSSGGDEFTTPETNEPPSLSTDFYVTEKGDVIPATGYRYMDTKYAEQTFETNKAPGSYFSFDKFDLASEARDALQISTDWSNAGLRGEFDTLQIIDDIRIPYEYGDTGTILEPFTESYPEFGAGGYRQVITNSWIEFKPGGIRLLD